MVREQQIDIFSVHYFLLDCDGGPDQVYYFVVVHELVPAEGTSRTFTTVRNVDQNVCENLCTKNKVCQ